MTDAHESHLLSMPICGGVVAVGGRCTCLHELYLRSLRLSKYLQGHLRVLQDGKAKLISDLIWRHFLLGTELMTRVGLELAPNCTMILLDNFGDIVFLTRCKII